MVPSLPAELLLSIVHHSLPPFLTSTHASRITQLCTLSLVSPTFLTFAQPLLLAEVRLSKPRQLNALLKVLRERGGGARIKRVFVSLSNTRERRGTKVKKLEKESVPALLEMCENVEEVSLAWLIEGGGGLGQAGQGEEYVPFLRSLRRPLTTKLAELHSHHLLCPHSHPPPPFQLPILRLTLYRPPPALLTALLTPTSLPSLHSLSLQETPLNDTAFTATFPLLAPQLTTVHLAQLSLRDTAFPLATLTNLHHLAMDDTVVLPAFLAKLPTKLESFRLLTPWKDPYSLAQDLRRLSTLFKLALLPPSLSTLETLIIPASAFTEGPPELREVCGRGRVRVGERRVETFVTVAAGKVVTAACEDWDSGFEREGGGWRTEDS